MKCIKLVCVISYTHIYIKCYTLSNFITEVNSQMDRIRSLDLLFFFSFGIHICIEQLYKREDLKIFGRLKTLWLAQNTRCFAKCTVRHLRASLSSELWMIYLYFSLAMGRTKIMRQTFIKLWHDLRAFYLKTSQKREITVITAVML